jgi:hypothetical protein
LTDRIAQLCLLAQGPNLENWTDLLIVVVMAVLWLGGVLAKTLSAKRSTQRTGQTDPTGRPSPPRQTWQERLARKVEEIQQTAQAQGVGMARRLEQKTGLPAGGRQGSPTRPPGGEITIRQGPRGESVMVYERPKAQPPAPPAARPSRAPRPRQAVAGAPPTPISTSALPQAKIETEGPAKPILQALPSVTFELPASSEADALKTNPLSEPADVGLPAPIDSGDSDALRKAILHYEILGKPLAFRDLFEV